MESTVLPGATPAERFASARAAGADFIQWAIVETGPLAPTVERPGWTRADGFLHESVRVSSLKRFSEIFTHPTSRPVVLERLDRALTLASVLQARTLTLAVKELVPAEVAVPAYRVGLNAAVKRADSLGIRIILEPTDGWPVSEALELWKGIDEPRIGWGLTLDPDIAHAFTDDAPRDGMPDAVRVLLSTVKDAVVIRALSALVRQGWDGPVVIGRDHPARQADRPGPDRVPIFRDLIESLRRRV